MAEDREDTDVSILANLSGPADLKALDDAQLTELAAVIAWENHRARLNRALGVRAVGFSDGAYCVLPHSAD